MTFPFIQLCKILGTLSCALFYVSVSVQVQASTLAIVSDRSSAAAVSLKTKRRVREGLTKLLRLSLLQGSFSEGVRLQNLVHDHLARQKDDEAALRRKQRQVVDALLSARPEEGFFSDALRLCETFGALDLSSEQAGAGQGAAPAA